MSHEPEIRFSVSGAAVAADGSRAPFELSLSEPFPHERHDWQCRVVCPTFRETPMHIYGDEPDFAWDMTLCFVHLMLGDMDLTVVDRGGQTIRFPKPDLARWDLTEKADTYCLRNQ